MISLEAKKKRGRRESAITLTAKCKGSLDLEALHAAWRREGSGVAAMQRTAWLHRGSLLWLERDGVSIAALRLGGINRAGGWPAGHPYSYSDVPDYVEMLSDPCSQVYVGLAPTGTISGVVPALGR